MTSPPRLVLASGSPRRLELLRQLGLASEVRAAAVDEAIRPDEEPAAHVERLAREKAEAVALMEADSIVIGGDTVVVHRGDVLGKPMDENDAVAMLGRLSGDWHEVLSGVAVCAAGRTLSGVGRARVLFRTIDDVEARSYVATGEPMDKAGAYGIQGSGAALVEELAGDYYAVVGLPIGRLLHLLEVAGWRYRFGILEPTSPEPG
jgi:septum formation protein